MTIKKTLLTFGLAALALGVTAAGASAASAVATGSVNVRSGPGTDYSVIDRLRGGERVEVDRCRGSWCYVQKRGPDGWVSAAYLDNGRYYDERPPIRRPAPPPRFYDRYDRYDRYDDYGDGYRYDRPYRRPYFDGPRYPRHRGGSSACFGDSGLSFCFSD